MKTAVSNKQFRFYLKIGLGYLLLWLFVDLVSETHTFFPRAANETWKAVYLVAVNYLFFEFVLPRLSRKKILLSFILGASSLISSSTYEAVSKCFLFVRQSSAIK